MVNRRCLGPKTDIEMLTTSVSHDVDKELALNLPGNLGPEWALGSQNSAELT
jgi:hypothetical protein